MCKILLQRVGIDGYRRYLIVGTVALVTALLSFPMDPLLKQSMDNVVSKENMFMLKFDRLISYSQQIL